MAAALPSARNVASAPLDASTGQSRIFARDFIGGQG